MRSFRGTGSSCGRLHAYHPLDFLFPVRWLGLKNGQFYLAVRNSLFTGNFKYIGGNEDFDVTTTQWGVGGGFVQRSR
jgi:hypothetical protein